MWGISWLAENRLASQEGLSCMEWVSEWVSYSWTVCCSTSTIVSESWIRIISTTTTNNVHLQFVANTKAEWFTAFQKAPFPPHATRRWYKSRLQSQHAPSTHVMDSTLRNVGDSCLSVTCNTKPRPNNPTYGREPRQVTSSSAGLSNSWLLDYVRPNSTLQISRLFWTPNQRVSALRASQVSG